MSGQRFETRITQRQLSTEERLTLAIQQNECLHLKDEKDLERKNAMKEFNGAITELDTQAREFGRTLERGYVDQKITCYVRVNVNDQTVEYYDVETMELIDAEPLKKATQKGPGEQLDLDDFEERFKKNEEEREQAADTIAKLEFTESVNARLHEFYRSVVIGPDEPTSRQSYERLVAHRNNFIARCIGRMYEDQELDKSVVDFDLAFDLIEPVFNAFVEALEVELVEFEDQQKEDLIDTARAENTPFDENKVGTLNPTVEGEVDLTVNYTESSDTSTPDTTENRKVAEKPEEPAPKPKRSHHKKKTPPPLPDDLA